MRNCDANVGDTIIEKGREYLVIDTDYDCGGNCRLLYCVKKNVAFKWLRHIYTFGY